MTSILNQQVSEHLQLIGQLKNLAGDNGFSIRAYQEASKSITFLSEPVSAGKAMEMVGVGEKIATVIEQFIETGSSDVLSELSSRFPVSALKHTIVRGIGPKKAMKLYAEGYHSFEELHAAALKGELDGKLAANVILASLQKSGRFPFETAFQIGQYFQETLQKVPGVSMVETGGSIRRKAESAKDVDVLACVVSNEARPAVMEAFKFYGPETFQGQENKASIQYPVSADRMIQVDLWIATEDYWGTLLNHCTGSKEHNIKLRQRAKERGMTVSEYGIFAEDGTKLGGEKETDLYRLLNIPYVVPENRTGILPEGDY